MSHWYAIPTINSTTYGGNKEEFTDYDYELECAPYYYQGALFGTPNNKIYGLSFGNQKTFRLKIVENGYSNYIMSRAYNSASASYSRYGYWTIFKSSTYLEFNNLPLNKFKPIYLGESSSIRGRYRLGSLVKTGFEYGLFAIPLKFSINDKNFNILWSPRNTTNFSINNATTYEAGRTDAYNTTFGGYNYTETEQFTDGTIFNKKSTSTELLDEYKNSIIDFGRVRQEVPQFIVDFFNNNFEPVFEGSYTIKNQTGTEEFAQIIEAPAMVKGNLAVYGNTKTLILTGANDKTYTLTWDSITPEGYTFTGLSYDANSSIPNIGIGVDTFFNIEGNIVLYETYSKYQPPPTTFNVITYNNSAENNRLDKTDYLSSETTISGVLRSESSLTNVIINIEYNGVPNFNYVYIPIFSRYYYVNDIISIRNNMWQISLTVDVLMSYKDAILQCTGFIDRNENARNPYLVDNKRIVLEGRTVDYTYVSNSVFGGATYVLSGLNLVPYQKEE